MLGQLFISYFEITFSSNYEKTKACVCFMLIIKREIVSLVPVAWFNVLLLKLVNANQFLLSFLHLRRQFNLQNNKNYTWNWEFECNFVGNALHSQFQGSDTLWKPKGMQNIWWTWNMQNMKWKISKKLQWNEVKGNLADLLTEWAMKLDKTS